MSRGLTPGPAVGRPVVRRGGQTAMQAPVQVLTAGPDDGPDRTSLRPGVSNDSVYSVRPPDAVVVDNSDARWRHLGADTGHSRVRQAVA